MIVKKVKTKIDGKRREHQIADLVDYIRSAKGKDVGEKLIYTGSRNFFHDVHVAQKVEMLALARESVHSEMPVSHWVFSWPQGEIPNPAHVEQLVDIFLKVMKLEGHQAIFGLHGNTDNFHVHIAVNRMNAETGLVVRVNNGFDIKQAHKALAIIENTQGWKPEDNARYCVVDGEVVEKAKVKKLEPSQAAQSFEQHTGIKSAERIAQEEAHAIFKAATSWEELHSKLAPLGIKYIKKGSGAIIQVDDTPVKASSVDRAFALGKMEKRLGKFAPMGEEEEIQTHPRPVQPVSEVNMDEWRAYLEDVETLDHSAIRQRERQVLEQQRRKLAEDTKAKFAKVPGVMRQYGRHVGNLAQGAIKADRRQKQRSLLRDFRSNRRKLPTIPTFKYWLLKNGLREQADKWRYRKRLGKLAKSEIPPLESQTTAPNMPPAKAYRSHFDNIVQEFGNERMDISRVDAMIAVRMRENGYSKDDVAATIEQCAPTIRTKKDANAYQWDDYAGRMADYAFGPAGDIALQKFRQDRKLSGAELADQLAKKKKELEAAMWARKQAGYTLDSAKQNVRYRERDIEEHKVEVDSQGFLSGIANLASNLSRGRELNKAHKEALEELEVARTAYNEKSAVEDSLKKEVKVLEIAFAETPLGKEQKRQEEERLKKEQEAQRERERYAQKERELMRQRAMGIRPKEDGGQPSQAPQIRMR